MRRFALFLLALLSACRQNPTAPAIAGPCSVTQQELLFHVCWYHCPPGTEQWASGASLAYSADMLCTP